MMLFAVNASKECKLQLSLVCKQFLRFYLVGKEGELLYQCIVVVLRREVL